MPIDELHDQATPQTIAATEQPMTNIADGTPKFGRLLIVLVLAVMLMVIITIASEAYYS